MTDYKCSHCAAPIVRYPNARFTICQYCRTRFDFPMSTEVVRVTNSIDDAVVAAKKYIHQNSKDHIKNVNVSGSEVSKLDGVTLYIISGNITVETAPEKLTLITKRVRVPAVLWERDFVIDVRVEDLRVIAFEYGKFERVQ